MKAKDKCRTAGGSDDRKRVVPNPMDHGWMHRPLVGIPI
jgi:hypothetical protein